MKYEIICSWCQCPTGNTSLASNSHGICTKCKKKVLEKAMTDDKKQN